MKKLSSHQKLPSEWAEREKLRQKGQFWTPDWVAEAMVQYVSEDSNLIFDPAVGKGAFYSALLRINELNHANLHFYGTDIDKDIIGEAKDEGLFDERISKIEIKDFILNPPKCLYKSIVANPPYIRHHRLSAELKVTLKEISLRAIGRSIDGRAGLHIYFLIQALTLLQEDGKLAFIMPSDTCEGVFSRTLWEWITRKYRLEGVISFSPEATPFPNVDTNALVFLIRKATPVKQFYWAKVLKQGTTELKSLIQTDFRLSKVNEIKVIKRDLSEALIAGLSKDPDKSVKTKYVLGDFARVMRGIATGDNEFFFLNDEQVRRIGIPKEYLRLAIGKTKDVDGLIVDQTTIDDLVSKGRPTCLFYPNGYKFEDLPKKVQDYIKEGESRGLPQKALISTRKPWYRMETREIPPFLFAYLGRRNARFVRNLANVVPLTGFLCIYPLSNDMKYIDKFWGILKNSETTDNLYLIGKSYGSGAIKVEPRSLEKLPIPDHLVEQCNIKPLYQNPLPELFNMLNETKMKTYKVKTIQRNR